MLTKSPEYSSSDYIRYAIYLVLLGACAARQLPPDPDVAGVDTVFMPMRPNAHTVTIHTRFPPVDTPLRNFLVITAIATVNNFAERGVALIQDYNQILTKDEQQRQYLLQVVELHRRKFLNANKTTTGAELLD